MHQFNLSIFKVASLTMQPHQFQHQEHATSRQKDEHKDKPVAACVFLAVQQSSPKKETMKKGVWFHLLTWCYFPSEEQGGQIWPQDTGSVTV